MFKRKLKLVHGHPIETGPIKIRNQIGSSSADTDQGLHTARPPPATDTQVRPGPSLFLVVLIITVGENCWSGGWATLQSFSRCKVVAEVPSFIHITLRGTWLSPKEPFFLISQLTVGCMSFELKTEVTSWLLHGLIFYLWRKLHSRKV